MGPPMLAAIALIVIGSALDAPIVILLGVATLLLDVVHAVWARAGLGGICYERRLATRHAPFGEAIPLEIEVWNRRRLPLAWLRADDVLRQGRAGPRAVCRGRRERGAPVLRNAWTLRPWERVRRRVHVFAERRGVFTVGPVDLSAGDPFARRVAAERRTGSDMFLVWPRTIPTTEVEPPDRWGDLERARGGLAEDPSRFAGVRPYAPGDPLPPTARPRQRTPRPADDQALRAVAGPGGADRPRRPGGRGGGLGDRPRRRRGGPVRGCRVSRALPRAALGGFRDPGGRVHGRRDQGRLRGDLVAPGQAERVLDLLARLSSQASMPFERLLVTAARTIRPGTTVLVLTVRDPGQFIPALRRLQAGGGDVVVVGCGPLAARVAERAREAGFAARRASMDGPWRTAGRLVIAR